MKIEAKVRDLTMASPLGRSHLVLNAYRSLNRFRFRNRWTLPVSFRGFEFVIGEDESLYPAVATGSFERAELDWLLSKMHPGLHVWDVGANVGLYSVILGATDETVVVDAFEPVEATRALLLRNLALNRIANVRVHPIGLGDVPGTFKMNLASNAAGSNSLIGAGNAFGDDGIELVTICRGDDWQPPDDSAPDVIKVDIEGFEPNFVDGSRRIITDRRPVLLLELNANYVLRSAASAERWQCTLDWLFETYREAMLFDVREQPVVDGLDVRRLTSAPRPLSLGFHAERT